MDEILKMLAQNPDLAKGLISGLVENYKPIAYAIGNELVKLMKDFSENKDYFATIANIKINMYKAYLNVGFNEEQAMQLMINDYQAISKSLSNNASAIFNTKTKEDN